MLLLLLFISVEVWKTPNQASVGFSSWWVLPSWFVSGHRLTASSKWSLPFFFFDVRKILLFGISLPLLIRFSSLGSTLLTSSERNYLPKAHPPNITAARVRASVYEFREGDADIQSITFCLVRWQRIKFCCVWDNMFASIRCTSLAYFLQSICSEISTSLLTEFLSTGQSRTLPSWVLEAGLWMLTSH